METLWTFKTARFTVKWQVEFDPSYRYDGDDDDGSIQAAIDSGEMVAFDSKVSVWLDGCEISADYLGGSVYYAHQVETFRDHVGMNARGHGSYFSDMIRTAIKEARATLSDVPRIRRAA